MSHVEDRWFITAGGAKQRSARHGTGLRWRARYEDPDGRERSRSFTTKAAADNFLTQVEHSKLSGSYRDPDAGRITLRKYAEGWVRHFHADSSRGEDIRRQLRLHILPGLGGEMLAQLAQRPTLVKEFIKALPMAPGGASQVAVTLSAIFNAAVEDGLIPRNPCKTRGMMPSQPKPKIDPWTVAQIAALRAALPPQWRAVADCGSGLGLRQGEILGLATDAVGFLQRRVRVSRQIRYVNGRMWFGLPKEDKERDVPLPGSVAEALAEHIKAYPPVEVTLPWNEPTDPKRHGKPVTAALAEHIKAYPPVEVTLPWNESADPKRHGKPVTAALLFTKSGGALNRSTFNTMAWRPARDAAGIAEGGVHQLRHFYASALLAGGVDIKALSVYLGHHDPAVTLRIYAHLMPSAEGRALRAIEAAFAEADNAGSRAADGPQASPRRESGA